MIWLKACSDSPELLRAPAVLQYQCLWVSVGFLWGVSEENFHPFTPTHTHSFTPTYFNYSVTHLPFDKMKFVPLMLIKSMSVNLWSAGWIIRGTNYDQAAAFNLLWHWHHRLTSNGGYVTLMSLSVSDGHKDPGDVIMYHQINILIVAKQHNWLLHGFLKMFSMLSLVAK